MSRDEVPRDCLRPPPDGTRARESYDRFTDFLRMAGPPSRDRHGYLADGTPPELPPRVRTPVEVYMLQWFATRLGEAIP